MTKTRSTRYVLPPADIIALRKRLQLTQEEFAHAIGVTTSSVNRWENGHIGASRLAVKVMHDLAAKAGISDLLPTQIR